MSSYKLKIEVVGFFLRPNKPELRKDFDKLKSSFEQFGIKVIVENESAKMIGVQGISLEQLFKISDILISLGGDGTLLSTVRRSFNCSKPILPINGGRLGFLAGLRLDEAHKFISNLVYKKYKIEKRKILKIEFKNGDKNFALNDIVITNRERMKMSNIQVLTDSNDEIYEKQLLNRYYGDALIISTPTGSTAYNLSSGGPILHPEMSSYILTPIAPHSLTQRPIVLPSRLNIHVSLEESDGVLVIDGQEIINLVNGDFIKVSLSPIPIKIIRVEDYNFFDTLREKLKWGTD
jgi:NAD+ kinase